MRHASTGFLVGVALVASLGAFGTGCQVGDIERIEIPNVFRIMPERPLADVPVPVGFRYREKGSYLFNNNYRVACIRYRGSNSHEETEAFYKEQMPLSHWTFVRASGERERVLEFQNELETCTVKLYRKGGFGALDIEIMPRKT